jgi:hypothetical protein
MVWPREKDARGQNNKINYGMYTIGEKKKRTSNKNGDERSTNSHDSKKFGTRSMQKQEGIELGFRKTATAVIKPDRQINLRNIVNIYEQITSQEANFYLHPFENLKSRAMDRKQIQALLFALKRLQATACEDMKTSELDFQFSLIGVTCCGKALRMFVGTSILRRKRQAQGRCK